MDAWADCDPPVYIEQSYVAMTHDTAPRSSCEVRTTTDRKSKEPAWDARADHSDRLHGPDSCGPFHEIQISEGEAASPESRFNGESGILRFRSAVPGGARDHSLTRVGGGTENEWLSDRLQGECEARAEKMNREPLAPTMNLVGPFDLLCAARLSCPRLWRSSCAHVAVPSPRPCAAHVCGATSLPRVSV